MRLKPLAQEPTLGIAYWKRVLIVYDPIPERRDVLEFFLNRQLVEARGGEQ